MAISSIPAWLRATLAAAPSPRAACESLLFHGTIEKFDGRLVASKWEGLRWTAEDPCIAQSYCPETGGLTGWSSAPAYDLDGWLLPQGPINTALFHHFGFDPTDLDGETDHTGRYQSFRILPGHPTNRMALTRMLELGYEAKNERFVWVKTSRQADGSETILPADHRDQGRLFILERPADLRIHDHSKLAEGGLTGRQWMDTEAFAAARREGFDAIAIDDVHQSKQLGHFGHRSLGLYDHALARLRYHVIDIVHFDPWDSWKHSDGSSTPEFDALWTSCQPAIDLAA